LFARAQGLANGYYDGISGLVTEPVAGGKKEGFLGAIKGAGRSYVNATMKVRVTPLNRRCNRP
jgi:sterol 3beta-glucosyltransferase